MPNSLCHFWKHKSVCVQNLHQFLVPSNIIPLYFFSLNTIYFGQKLPINPIQDGLSQGCSRMEGQKATPPPPPALKSATHILQWWNLAPYLKKFQKLYESHDMTHPLCSANISIFLPEISKFCYIKKYWYRFHLDT